MMTWIAIGVSVFVAVEICSLVLLFLFVRLRRMDEQDCEVEISCEVDGHTYVVTCSSVDDACQAWAAFAADPEVGFTWTNAAEMNVASRRLFKRIGAVNRG